MLESKPLFKANLLFLADIISKHLFTVLGKKYLISSAFVYISY